MSFDYEKYKKEWTAVRAVAWSVELVKFLAEKHPEILIEFQEYLKKCLGTKRR